jgi:hypothetical protein
MFDMRLSFHLDEYCEFTVEGGVYLGWRIVADVRAFVRSILLTASNPTDRMRRDFNGADKT